MGKAPPVTVPSTKILEKKTLTRFREYCNTPEFFAVPAHPLKCYPQLGHCSLLLLKPPKLLAEIADGVEMQMTFGRGMQRLSGRVAKCIEIRASWEPGRILDGAGPRRSSGLPTSLAICECVRSVHMDVCVSLAYVNRNSERGRREEKEIKRDGKDGHWLAPGTDSPEPF